MEKGSMGKGNMRKMKKFERLLKEMQAGYFSNRVLLAGLFWIVSGVEILWTSGIWRRTFLYLDLWWFGFALYWYLEPYLYLLENDKRVSIYRILSYPPVSTRDIYRAQMGHLNKYCLFVAGYQLILYQLIGFIKQNWTKWNVLDPLIVTGFLWFFGWVYLKGLWKKAQN